MKNSNPDPKDKEKLVFLLSSLDKLPTSLPSITGGDGAYSVVSSTLKLMDLTSNKSTSRAKPVPNY
jgi:hypothetical protein